MGETMIGFIKRLIIKKIREAETKALPIGSKWQLGKVKNPFDLKFVIVIELRDGFVQYKIPMGRGIGEPVFSMPVSRFIRRYYPFKEAK